MKMWLHVSCAVQRWNNFGKRKLQLNCVVGKIKNDLSAVPIFKFLEYTNELLNFLVELWLPVCLF